MDPPPITSARLTAMDTPPITVAAAAAATTTCIPATTITDPPPRVPSAKLRLMCSYGGHIVPRPHDKSLSYAGGDTRIVAVDRRSASFAALTAHLSATLLLPRPFAVKYQLPGHDLDSLVSVASDEDFDNMLDEYDRAATAPTPSRLRIFLFPEKPAPPAESILGDPESEAWLFDALRVAKIGGKDRFTDAGAGGCLFGVDGCGGGLESNVGVEGQTEGLAHGGGVGMGSMAESIVLETSSSFGSTSSSVSVSNMPAIRAHLEEGLIGLEKKVKFPATESTDSERSGGSSISHPLTGNYQDIVDNRVISNHVELESNVSEPLPEMHMQQTVQVSGCPQPLLVDQQEQQQELRYVPITPHYLSQYQAGPLPIASYYPVYQAQLHQLQQQQQQPLQQCHYQPNQPYPVYILPVGQTQGYTLPTHCNLVGAGPMASGHSPMHPNITMVPPPVAYKEVTPAASIPVLASKVCRTAPEANPLNNVALNQNQQQLVSPQMHLPSLTIPASTMATANYNNELDDDPALAQIYKSQPPAPKLPLQYQTMTKATADLLSGALTQLHTDNMKP